jgi:hypothetical protein
MKHVNRLIKLIAISLAFGANALAATTTTTIESSVILDSPTGPATERIVRITGPDKIEYRVQAPATEIERLSNMVRDNPKVVLSFNGDIETINGVRTFRVDNWKKVETTTTKTTTDNAGNKSVESTTETHTE